MATPHTTVPLFMIASAAGSSALLIAFPVASAIKSTVIADI